MWLVRFRYIFDYEIQLKKHVKTVSQKLHFKLNFLVGHAVQNTV
jgi:hypothetical protein